MAVGLTGGGGGASGASGTVTGARLFMDLKGAATEAEEGIFSRTAWNPGILSTAASISALRIEGSSKASLTASADGICCLIVSVVGTLLEMDLRGVINLDNMIDDCRQTYRASLHDLMSIPKSAMLIESETPVIERLHGDYSQVRP